MIIWMDRPLANDHPDGPASCKFSSGKTGLLQLIIQRIRPLANDHPATSKWSSGGSGLLQMIIWRDWPLASYHPYGPPLANDYPEGLASCKWSYGGYSHLQMITRKIHPLANDHLEGQAICKWPPGGSALLKLIIQRICPLLSDTFFDWIEIWFFSYSRLIRTFDLRIDFFEIFFVTTFLWVFLLILFRDFFYKLFLKKGMGESWAPTLPKICVFDLKNNLSAKKRQKKSQKPLQKNMVVTWYWRFSALIWPLANDIPHVCHFFTQAKFLENKIYTEICQFTQ